MKKNDLLTLTGFILMAATWGIYTFFPSELILYISIAVTGLALVLIIVGIKAEKAKNNTAQNADPMPPNNNFQEQTPPSPGAEATVLLGGGADATVLLGDNNQNDVRATLVFKDGKTVVVDNGKLVIGRNPENADYVLNTVGVSRAHLEIIKLDQQGFGVKDLGSKNGSKLNGVQMDANKMYPIKENDMVSFAKEEFTFKLG